MITIRLYLAFTSKVQFNDCNSKFKSEGHLIYAIFVSIMCCFQLSLFIEICAIN